MHFLDAFCASSGGEIRGGGTEAKTAVHLKKVLNLSSSLYTGALTQRFSQDAPFLSSARPGLSIK